MYDLKKFGVRLKLFADDEKIYAELQTHVILINCVAYIILL